MKKLFLSLMLVAAVAAGFTSCKKDSNESETHSQTFTLGETVYDVDNIITIENIKYEGSDIYNAIVLSQGQMIGDGGEGRGIAIFFKGDINAGTYNMTGNDNDYPKYVFASLTVEDIVNFDFNNLDNEESYFATSGSLTLEISDGKYIITTDGIEVENAKDPAIVETSSVDFEGTPSRYVLADVVEGNINSEGIVTAGTFTSPIPLIGDKIAAFITEEGNALGFTFNGNSIPTGEVTTYAIYLNKMDINTPQLTPNVNVVISVEDDIYTIDIENVTIGADSYTLHYVGTMPYFDFPF